MVSIKAMIFFGLTAALVVFLGYDFLKPAFEIGLTPEDREFILRYKLLGPNPFAKIWQVWLERGAYTTVPIYYIGIVQSLTGFNYDLIQFMGVLFRTLAILSIFPMVALVFKNIWLAMLTTIIFAFSYTTTGALETGVEPSEYLGFLMMNIFLIAYYFLNTKNFLDIRLLILTSFLLFVAVMTSVMRIYPILFFIPLIEIFLLFLNHKKYKFKYLFLKLPILYLPFLLLVIFSPLSASGHFSLPVIMTKVAQGNWHLLLTPFQGLGFMIPVGKYYGYLGTMDLNNFITYTTFLLGGPLIIFGFASLILSFISAQKRLQFFFRLLLLNFGLEVLIYWIVQQRMLVVPELRLDFDNQRLYPVLFGLFLFSLMVNYMIDWYRQGKKNNLLLVLWLGPFFGLFFISLTYIFAGLTLSFGGAQDHYLLVPTMGIGLMIAGSLLLLHKKLSTLRFGSIISIFFVFSILFLLYIFNRQLTHDYFNIANINGRAAFGQMQIQTRIKQKLKNIDYSRPLLVYFDTSSISGRGPFYSESLLTPFPFFMHLQGEEVIDGCIGVIYEDDRMVQLRGLIKEINNQLVVEHPLICVDGYNLSIKDIPIKLEDLYAYKIRDENFIDIKQQVIDELKLK